MTLPMTQTTSKPTQASSSERLTLTEGSEPEVTDRDG